jgi:hypothetical protein
MTHDAPYIRTPHDEIGSYQRLNPGWEEANAEAARAHEEYVAATRAWMDVRSLVVLRLNQLSFHHTEHARTGFANKIPGPHAMALLFAELVPTHGSFRHVISAATRMPVDTDHTSQGKNVRDASRLLQSWVEFSIEEHRAGPFDPRKLCDRVDETATERSSFIGVALSSLGTHGQDWSRTRTRDDLNVKADAYLIDGTWIETWRAGTETLYRSTGGMYHVPGSRISSSIPKEYQPPVDSPHEWIQKLVTIFGAIYQPTR